MNSSTRFLRRNFSYSLLSNIIVLLVSSLTTLILPKVIDVENYGYFQLYMLYYAYTPFTQLGWSDGVYLRYGGQDYQQLDKKVFSSQFFYLVISQCFITALLLFLVPTADNEEGRFILKALAAGVVITNAKHFLVMTLQATSRFKEYALTTILDKLFFIAGFIALFIIGESNFRIYIFLWLMSALVSFLIVAYYCKDIVFQSFRSGFFSIFEFLENIRAGLVLTLSNTASMLIIGSFRFAVERVWDVTVFAKVSLTLNISSFLLVFLRAISLVLFPVLRNIEQAKLSQVYLTLRALLLALLLIFLFMFYPLRYVIHAWLPAYIESASYMAIVFPIIVYESLQSLLLGTFLKTIRQEKALLRVNVVSLILAVILAMVTTVFFRNINLAVLSMTVVLAIRCFYAELILLSKLEMLKKNVVLGTLMMFAATAIFIASSTLLSVKLSFLVYLITNSVYLYLRRVEIRRSIHELKRVMKKQNRQGTVL